ncbi:MAG: SIS domain-containing protein [Alphaproteobacteria bacterium]|nr:SIS domain-containing protein [Alphaproteobacteria bacterium]
MDLQPRLDALIDEATRAIEAGGQLLVFGNGGSAADAQHLAAELVGRFAADRRALPALALSSDTAVLTAVANDLGYDRVFARQVEALARPGDLLLALSTSGSSPNVLRAVAAGAERGCVCWGMTGRAPNLLSALLTDRVLAVPSTETARIQEAHGFLGHVLCAQLERALRL